MSFIKSLRRDSDGTQYSASTLLTGKDSARLGSTGRINLKIKACVGEIFDLLKKGVHGKNVGYKCQEFIYHFNQKQIFGKAEKIFQLACGI